MYKDSTIELVSISRGDLPFLQQLYASTRADEVAAAGLLPAVAGAFLEQQFQRQHHHYQTQFPQAHFWLVHCQENPVGRFYLRHTPEHFHLIDISLLPAYRGRGIGRLLLTELLATADRQGLPIRLHANRDDTVFHWYQRLGFGITGSQGHYHAMCRMPSSPPASPPTGRLYRALSRQESHT
ncbi:GNAT family N-acetyltransferase [Zobellella denitrificans]|uniref:GNAT family N-acetyltransferase n=1 Tax=Zobellella denitrificans TaxID=347534 RepID=UPI0012FE07AD|nr:GNAT family N-acetyltransferase [Zobellella denitrificans]